MTLDQIFEFSKFAGSGGALILSIVVYKLWETYKEERDAYRKEVDYSKQRDRETLTVLSALAEKHTSTNAMEARILSAIEKLEKTIQDHLLENDDRKSERK